MKISSTENVFLETQPIFRPPVGSPPPQLDPEYNIKYYSRGPINWGEGSLWFLMAYAVIIFPLMFGVESVIGTVNSFPLLSDFVNISQTDFSEGIFFVTTFLGAISIICGLLGFVWGRENGYKVHPCVVGVVGSIIVGVVAYMLFL